MTWFDPWSSVFFLFDAFVSIKQNRIPAVRRSICSDTEEKKLKNVSKAMLARLPGYLNYLKSLPEDSSVHISATTMAKALELGDVQVRKDLAIVSGGGRRKTGHRRETLIRDIEEFLDHGNATSAVLVGAGKLGQALLDYPGFEIFGLDILAGFDLHPERSQDHPGKPVYAVSELERFCAENDVTVGIITVPVRHAQAVCDRLVACGVRAIWNFAPVHLKVPAHIPVQNENLAISLTELRMRLRDTEGE